MNIFPEITSLDEFWDKVKHKPEIRLIEQPNGFTTVCAMISDKDTYSGEEEAWLRECRGITFDRDGKIACRTLHKFFNVNERVNTKAEALDWSSVKRSMTKMDGSMITPVLVDGHIVFKSKKSFGSEVARLANATATNNIRELSEILLRIGYTPTFEITSPSARIVLKYDTTSLTLLHVRHNVTGEYYDREQLELISEFFNVPLVEDVDFAGWDSTSNYLENEATGIEGFVYQFENGDMVKAKCKWYLDLHHSVTFVTERAVAEMVINEVLDDYKSYLVDINDLVLLTKVEEIETRVKSWFVQTEASIDTVIATYTDMDRKSFAIKYKDNCLFGLLMAAYLGKEPNLSEYFVKHILKEEYSLDVIE